MSGGRYRYSPAFRVIESGGILSPPTITELRVANVNTDPDAIKDPGRFDLACAQTLRQYWVYGSPEATGRYMSPFAGPYLLDITTASQVPKFRFNVEPNGWHRRFWFWNEIGVVGIAGVSDSGLFFDWDGDEAKWKQPRPTLETTEPPFGDNPNPFDVHLSNKTIIYGIAPDYDPLFVNRTATDSEPIVERGTVTAVTYEDLADDPERENLDKRLRVRQRGFRPRVSIRFRVRMGSAFERDLQTVLSCQQAPEIFGIYFTLNADAANPQWREVQIVGGFPRTTINGQHDLLEFSWDVVGVEPQPTLPGIAGDDGRGLW